MIRDVHNDSQIMWQRIRKRRSETQQLTCKSPNTRQNRALKQAERPAARPLLFYSVTACCRSAPTERLRQKSQNSAINPTQSTPKQSASFTPTLPGSMMRLRRGWNSWRLRGRALTSERLRYFGPALYNGADRSSNGGRTIPAVNSIHSSALCCLHVSIHRHCRSLPKHKLLCIQRHVWIGICRLIGSLSEYFSCFI